MEISEAIKKAIKGGYADFYRGITPNGYLHILVFDHGENEKEMTVFQILLDPQFWQSLGKSMGWDDKDCICSITGEKTKRNPVWLADCLCHREPAVYWLSEWHKFIDHLAEGKSIEDFFKELK